MNSLSYGAGVDLGRAGRLGVAADLGRAEVGQNVRLRGVNQAWDECRFASGRGEIHCYQPGKRK